MLKSRHAQLLKVSQGLRVFVATTENAAFTGSYNKNPFLFKHNHLTSAGACVNGISIPANPITLNFQNGDFPDGYRSLFTTTGKINCDEGTGNKYKDDSVYLVLI